MHTTLAREHSVGMMPAIGLAAAEQTLKERRSQALKVNAF